LGPSVVSPHLASTGIEPKAMMPLTHRLSLIFSPAYCRKQLDIGVLGEITSNLKKEKYAKMAFLLFHSFLEKNRNFVLSTSTSIKNRPVGQPVLYKIPKN
jgi:hypothetical protein